MRYRYQCECGLTVDGRPNKDGEILPSNQATDLSEPIRPMLCEKCLRRDPAEGSESQGRGLRGLRMGSSVGEAMSDTGEKE